MADELNTVFGGEAPSQAAQEPAGGEVTRASATIPTDPPAAPTAPANGAYDGEEGLRDFALSQPDGTWRYDYAKIAKTMGDRLSHISRQENTIKELREQAGQDAPTAPLNASEYAEGFDHEALQKAAGRAYLGRDEQGRNVTEMAFWNAMHANGVPVEAGRKAFAQFMEGMHGAIEEPQTQAQRLEQAVTEMGPNGRQQLADVNDWVGGLHVRQPFTEGQQRMVNAMMHSGDGLAVLWRLSRMGGSAAPPNAAGAAGSTVMTRAEIQQAMVTDRYKTDAEYRQQVQDALAKHNAGGHADRYSVSIPVS